MNMTIDELKAEVTRLREIVNKFKVHGTDGCKTCETGRITMFIANEYCITCKPDDYEIARKALGEE